MFYDTFSTVCLDCPVSLTGDPLHVLDVEMLEAATVFGDSLHATIRHQGAALHAELLQVGTVF